MTTVSMGSKRPGHWVRVDALLASTTRECDERAVSPFAPVMKAYASVSGREAATSATRVLRLVGIAADRDELQTFGGSDLSRIGLGMGESGLEALVHEFWRLVEESFHHLGLWNDPDHLPLYEEMAPSPTGGDPDVGLPGLDRGR